MTNDTNCMNCMVGRFKDDLCSEEICKVLRKKGTSFEFENMVLANMPRRGRWVDMGDFEQCSICACTHLKEIQSYYGKTSWIKTPYCPYCGAKMEEP